MERPRWHPPEEDKHGGRSLIWLCRKFFISLKLHLFSLPFTYCLFRPQKHKVNQRFQVCDICFPAVPDVTDGEKSMKFKLLHFPNKVGYRAGNMQADIS